MYDNYSLNFQTSKNGGLILSEIN